VKYIDEQLGSRIGHRRRRIAIGAHAQHASEFPVTEPACHRLLVLRTCDVDDDILSLVPLHLGGESRDASFSISGLTVMSGSVRSLD